MLYQLHGRSLPLRCCTGRLCASNLKPPKLMYTNVPRTYPLYHRDETMKHQLQRSKPCRPIHRGIRRPSFRAAKKQTGSGQKMRTNTVHSLSIGRASVRPSVRASLHARRQPQARRYACVRTYML